MGSWERPACLWAALPLPAQEPRSRLSASEQDSGVSWLGAECVTFQLCLPNAQLSVSVKALAPLCGWEGTRDVNPGELKGFGKHPKGWRKKGRLRGWNSASLLFSSFNFFCISVFSTMNKVH